MAVKIDLELATTIEVAIVELVTVKELSAFIAMPLILA